MAYPNTEQKILKAAREVFVEKGYAASRMQEIADRAGINKGLLHYYFTTKDNIFRAVFREAFQAFLPSLRDIFNSADDIRTKIAQLIRSYLALLHGHPHLPAFVIHELNHNPQAFVEMLEGLDERPDILIFFEQIAEASERGEIARVQPAHLFLNIISLCIFPFLVKPVFMALTSTPEDLYQELLNQRAEVIESMILKQLEP